MADMTKVKKGIRLFLNILFVIVVAAAIIMGWMIRTLGFRNGSKKKKSRLKLLLRQSPILKQKLPSNKKIGNIS